MVELEEDEDKRWRRARKDGRKNNLLISSDLGCKGASSLLVFNFVMHQSM